MKKEVNVDFFPNTQKTKQFIAAISGNLYDELLHLDRAQLEKIIEICNQFSATNCGWIEYALRQGIASLASSRLYEITPSSQLKNKTP